MARLLPFPEQPSRAAAPGAKRAGVAWLSWWLALCLCILAWNTHRQVAIQGRILTGSRELEQVVAGSRAVSAETNRQLAALQELDWATARLDGRLARVGQVNAAIKADLAALEVTAAAIADSIDRMDSQAAHSRNLLREIAELSAALHRTLSDSRTVGDQVQRNLLLLVDAQEAINADLAEMDRKTRLLERLGGGGGE